MKICKEKNPIEKNVILSALLFTSFAIWTHFTDLKELYQMNYSFFKMRFSNCKGGEHKVSTMVNLLILSITYLCSSIRLYAPQ